MMDKLKESKLVVFFYRLCKVFCYRIIYDTFIYKIIYPHKLSDVFKNNTKYKLIFCHNKGGGTLTYLINKYGKDKNTLIIRNTVTADKDYLYSIENNETHKRVYLQPKEINKLGKVLTEIRIVSVESYMSIEVLFSWIKTLNLPVTYDLHDFHCIWLIGHLCDFKGYLSESQIKNAKLNYCFTKITYASWHKTWEKFFPYVSNIYAFSNSSKELFSHYFPAFESKVKVTPHSLEYIKFKSIESFPNELRIGIFGAIQSVDKGCLVVKDFLNYMKEKESQIIINGSLRSDCCINAKNIFYEGKYDVDNLRNLIINQKLSVALFPSVWPETFSYLVSELIAAGIPLACFDMGAQAEKVSEYKYGQIITDFTSEEILKALQIAYQKAQKNIQ